MSEEIMESDISNKETVNTKEEYAYLDRGGFSSENFKIELRGLPKFYGIAELKKLMNQKLELNSSKIKRPWTGSHWLYACFQNEEDRSKAIKALNGYNWKGKTLIAEEAKPAPDPLIRKRKQGNDTPVNAKKAVEDTRTTEERLKDVTTCLWEMPYEKQLELKEKTVRDILLKFDNERWKSDRNRRSFIEAQRKLNNGLSFNLLPIEPSPITEGYRNKCEFTVGIDGDTKEPVVGFRLGSYVTGTVEVAPVQTLQHITEKTKQAALIFQEFVRKSNLPPFSPADYSGYWRYLTVRHSTFSNEIMLIVALHPQNMTEAELDKLKADLVEHFSSEEAVTCGIKSLYFHLVTKKRAGEEGSKPIHLSGSTHIIDKILGLSFRISAEAFFQINTAAADKLYQKTIEMSKPTKDTTVLDICCGAGTIGLCFAQHCGKVLGLELVAEAVKDAKSNAELNGIKNCEFYTGKAEDVLPAVLALINEEDVVAIVDPPRAGLHMRAVTQLRNSKKIKRLVYMACSPSSVMKNFLDLTRPSSKTLKGAPFVPVTAVPVDMFPQTNHVELAVLFEREKEVEKPVQNADSNDEKQITVDENETKEEEKEPNSETTNDMEKENNL